jgi:hypothetical protein
MVGCTKTRINMTSLFLEMESCEGDGLPDEDREELGNLAIDDLFRVAVGAATLRNQLRNGSGKSPAGSSP